MTPLLTEDINMDLHWFHTEVAISDFQILITYIEHNPLFQPHILLQNLVLSTGWW